MNEVGYSTISKRKLRQVIDELKAIAGTEEVVKELERMIAK